MSYKKYDIRMNGNHKAASVERIDAHDICLTTRLGNTESYFFMDASEAKRIARKLLKLASISK